MPLIINYFLIIHSVLLDKLEDAHDKMIESLYSKVRLNIHKLSILTTDTTFATNSFTSYGNPTLCGDLVCIPGIANVDLRGTKFHLKVILVFFIFVKVVIIVETKI